MLRASRNFRNRSEKACSSCITRIISSRSILSAVQAVMAVAVDKRSPGTAASDSSPTKSPAERSVMVASLPFCRNDRDLCAALLKIEDGVGGISLRKEGLLGLHLDDSSSGPCLRQKVDGVKFGFC